MSSTMRLFINDNRISTAVKTKNGSILQVYPSRATFTNDVQWQAYWAEATKPKIVLRIGYPEDQATPEPTPALKRTSKTTKPEKAKLSDWSIGNKMAFVYDIPAGTYYIGDLCYALGNDIYDNIFGGTGYCSGIYEEKATKRLFLVAGTAAGDGMYPGSDGNEFAVDAGIIGICSSSLMEKSGDGGHVYTFKSPVRCKFAAGRFSFTSQERSLVVDTTGDDDAY